MAELVDVDTESLGGIPRGLCPGEIYYKCMTSCIFLREKFFQKP